MKKLIRFSQLKKMCRDRDFLHDFCYIERIVGCKACNCPIWKKLEKGIPDA